MTTIKIRKTSYLSSLGEPMWNIVISKWFGLYNRVHETYYTFDMAAMLGQQLARETGATFSKIN